MRYKVRQTHNGAIEGNKNEMRLHFQEEKQEWKRSESPITEEGSLLWDPSSLYSHGNRFLSVVSWGTDNCKSILQEVKLQTLEITP